MLTRRTLIVAAAVLSRAPLAGAATQASDEADAPLLTVTGKIDAPGGSVAFKRKDLEALGTISFQTRTPWHGGPVRFEGVSLRAVLRSVQAAAPTGVSAVARDGYAAEIPLTDIEQYEVILAMKRDGEALGTREKGPLWLVYPYDSDPALKTPKYYARSVWQVTRLVVN